MYTENVAAQQCIWSRDIHCTGDEVGVDNPPGVT